MKIYVDLKKTPSSMWMAMVAKAYEVEAEELQKTMAQGESVLYDSKLQAWKTISNEVKMLDYENDEIVFNHQSVSSFAIVQNMVANL